jgi:CPA2 family monovalent cation:H+ antiporter-2/glutathione-regulated potassium-efflux system protein KefB
MRAAGAESAKVLVLALDDIDASVRTAQIVKRKFPHLAVVARARNRHHVHLLMAAGVDMNVRETFYSSLKLTGLTLAALDVPKDQADRAIALFQAHDERILQETYPIAHDETQLIQTTQQAAAELLQLFESDRDVEK